MGRRTCLWVAAMAAVVLVMGATSGCCPFIPQRSSTGGPSGSGSSPGGAGAVAPATGDSSLSAGDKVAAVWDDGNFYHATVLSLDGNKITVRYTDDSTTKTVPSSDVVPIEVKTWAVGDRVLAVWSLGRFYPGVIEKASDPDYTVKWDDGSTPSQVSNDMIIAEQ